LGRAFSKKLFAVISSYNTEPAEVVPLEASRRVPENEHHEIPSTQPVNDKAHGREKVDVNSGFILAFDISYAIDTIKKNPIGLRRVELLQVLH